MRPPYKNLTVFAGRVGNDPEIRYLSSGDATVSVRVACQESWKDASAATGWKTHTEWAVLIFYRKDAEDLVAAGVRKGSFIHAEGRRHTRQWEDGEKRKKTAHEIIVSAWHVVAITPSAEATDRAEAQAQAHAPRPARSGAPAAKPPTAKAPATPSRGATERLA